MALLHLDNHFFFVVVIWHSARDDVSATLNTVEVFSKAFSQTLKLFFCFATGPAGVSAVPEGPGNPSSQQRVGKSLF